MRLERILILFLLLSLAVSCSDNDDDSVDAAGLFQIAYGTTHDLDSRTPGVVSFGSDHVVVTNVRLGNDDLTNYKLGVFMVGPTGAVKWSKIIHATEEETLFGYDVAKSSDSEFLILARSGENQFAHYSHPVVIRISASGDVLGADAYDYDLQEVMVMPYLTVLSDASVILSGYSIGYPVVIHSDVQRTVKWSHRPDMFGFSTRSAAFGQQVAHVFTNGFKVIIRKTRDDGARVWEKQVQLQVQECMYQKFYPELHASLSS
ncbi:hypothetical protein KK062_15835 [Fulvivirgaceae bacterium PWU5]|uniref:Lipoprotein n=1 Tax=Dawidia cretensis TaxID=2782350 RepID=A0AAP2E1D2_9BACT|nr:hypothetical protein [Dawidia cretensis]MBT1709714.1 hypothetical protein [Dawidia cretensis]